MGNLVNHIEELVGKQTKEGKLNICNFIIYIMTEALKRTFEVFTRNCNVPSEYRPIINMKNELTKKLLCVVIYIANSFNCWKRNQSAAKLL